MSLKSWWMVRKLRKARERHEQGYNMAAGILLSHAAASSQYGPYNVETMVMREGDNRDEFDNGAQSALKHWAAIQRQKA